MGDHHKLGKTCRFLTGIAIVQAGLCIIAARLLLDGAALTPVQLLAGIACIMVTTGAGGWLLAACNHHGRHLRRAKDVHA